MIYENIATELTSTRSLPACWPSSSNEGPMRWRSGIAASITPDITNMVTMNRGLAQGTMMYRCESETRPSNPSTSDIHNNYVINQCLTDGDTCNTKQMVPRDLRHYVI